VPELLLLRIIAHFIAPELINTDRQVDILRTLAAEKSRLKITSSHFFVADLDIHLNRLNVLSEVQTTSRHIRQQTSNGLEQEYNF